MRIDVSPILDEKGKKARYHLVEMPGVLLAGGRDVRLKDPADIDVEATNTGGGVILVRGSVRARVPVTCDRCLTAFELPVKADFEEEFKRAFRPRESSGGPAGDGCGRPGREGAEPDGTAGEWTEDGTARTFCGNHIQLRPVVEEALTLSLPMKVICREECKGLCPRCGKDLNLGPCNCRPDSPDVRMAPFAGLLEKMQIPEHED
ncbi:MAG TPA: DUF177 domain-containing protein [Firmicutes bacterium]|nr:DUF177 domain-containing protein [Bacillota bacterium]